VGIADKVKQTRALFPAEEPKAVSGRPCPPGQNSAAAAPQAPEPEVVKPRQVVAAPVEEKTKKKSWIEITLVDMEGKPVPGVRYRITLPDGGEPQEGTLNEFGQAGYYEIEPGTCTVTFPDLDAQAWEAA
jgi:hypothetical protein